jgi:DNA-binding CsgD family transcriptional regulator
VSGVVCSTDEPALLSGVYAAATAQRTYQWRSGLTYMELRVTRALLRGLDTRGIATSLSISAKTVNAHVSNILWVPETNGPPLRASSDVGYGRNQVHRTLVVDLDQGSEDTMALVTCPDCGKDVSERAPACPHCGAPIATVRDHHSVGVPIITVQKTSKRLKSHLLMSVGLFVVGLIWVSGSSASATTDATPSAVPGLLMTGAVLWFIVTRFRIWWEHR